MANKLSMADIDDDLSRVKNREKAEAEAHNALKVDGRRRCRRTTKAKP